MRHYFLLTNPSTGGKIQFIHYWNWMMTIFSLHISATLHLTFFGISSNNIKSVQYVICVLIVRGLWNIGLAIRYKIWIVAHLCTSRGTFLRINGKTTLSPWRDCRASLAVLQLSIIRLLQYDWLSGYWRVMNTVTCAMETWFLNIYSTFLWPLMNEWIQNMFVAFATICSVPMPNFTSI